MGGTENECAIDRKSGTCTKGVACEIWELCSTWKTPLKYYQLPIHDRQINLTASTLKKNLCYCQGYLGPHFPVPFPPSPSSKVVISLSSALIRWPNPWFWAYLFLGSLTHISIITHLLKNYVAQICNCHFQEPLSHFGFLLLWVFQPCTSPHHPFNEDEHSKRD